MKSCFTKLFFFFWFTTGALFKVACKGLLTKEFLQTPLFAATNEGIAVSAEVTDASLRVAIKNVKDHLEYPCSGLLVAGLLIRVRYIYLYAKRTGESQERASESEGCEAEMLHTAAKL